MIIKYIIMFLLRIIFMPVILSILIITAALTYMSVDKDWAYWKSYNELFIDILPWSKYKK